MVNHSVAGTACVSILAGRRCCTIARTVVWSSYLEVFNLHALEVRDGGQRGVWIFDEVGKCRFDFFDGPRMHGERPVRPFFFDLFEWDGLVGPFGFVLHLLPLARFHEPLPCLFLPFLHRKCLLGSPLLRRAVLVRGSVRQLLLRHRQVVGDFPRFFRMEKRLGSGGGDREPKGTKGERE